MKILILTMLLFTATQVNASLVTVTYDVTLKSYYSVSPAWVYSNGTLDIPLTGTISTSFETDRVQKNTFDEITPGSFIIGISERSNNVLNDQPIINWSYSFDHDPMPSQFTSSSRITEITANNYINDGNYANITSLFTNSVTITTSPTTGWSQGQSIQISTYSNDNELKSLVSTNLKTTFINSMNFGTNFFVHFGESKANIEYYNGGSSRVVNYDKSISYSGTATIRSVTDSADIASVPLPPTIVLFVSGFLGLGLSRRKVSSVISTKPVL